MDRALERLFPFESRLLRFRGLLATLTRRELAARYRGSLLGFLWSLVNPLLLLAVYTVVFEVVFRQRFGEVRPYAVFLVAGLFPWTWLATALLEGTVSLSARRPRLSVSRLFTVHWSCAYRAWMSLPAWLVIRRSFTS